MIYSLSTTHIILQFTYLLLFKKGSTNSVGFILHVDACSNPFVVNDSMTKKKM